MPSIFFCIFPWIFTPRATYRISMIVKAAVRDDRDSDRNNFLDRIGSIIQETKTPWLAWALILNYFHLLLKPGDAPVATLMRRLLTDHAVFYNKRHHRSGHLLRQLKPSLSGISLSVKRGEKIVKEKNTLSLITELQNLRAS